MKQYISYILFFLSVITVAQTIEKEWKFESIKNNNGISIVDINSNDSLKLAGGTFTYSLVSKDSLVAKGTYTSQNNLLTFTYSSPNDTVRSYKVVQLTDSVLTLSENQILYSFTSLIKSEDNCNRS